MVGIAVDPEFAVNGHIYLYYTYDKHHMARGRRRAPEERPGAGQPGLALHPRSSAVVDPRSERVLIDNIPSYAGNHNAR